MPARRCIGVSDFLVARTRLRRNHPGVSRRFLNWMTLRELTRAGYRTYPPVRTRGDFLDYARLRAANEGSSSPWHLGTPDNVIGRRLADRHYSRQSPGTSQFMPPGRKVVLSFDCGAGYTAVWGSHWPYARYAKHGFGDAWICSIYRNESPLLSSELIVQAMMATRAVWGDPPPGGMITFVRPDAVRRKRDPGRCFRRAGFLPVGTTAGGLLVLRIAPERMPCADPASDTWTEYTADFSERFDFVKGKLTGYRRGATNYEKRNGRWRVTG